MRDCAKSDRCKLAKKCPYEYNHLADFLCFIPQRYDKMIETKKRKKRKAAQIKKGNDKMTLADQIYIVVTDSMDGEEMNERTIAALTGLDINTIKRYINGTFPASLQKLDAILNALGFRLDVVPLSNGGE